MIITRYAAPAKREIKRRIRRSPVAPMERRLYSWSVNSRPPVYKQMLCLLIAAHNEELVLAKTLNSAISAGMDPENIYLVDDNSSDRTWEIATTILPNKNVLKVGRSGKGLALTKANRWFKLTRRYRWIHIADADGAFSPNYFRTFRRELRVENAAATGYIKSLPGKRISEFRVFEYTVGMEIHRRIQTMLKVIPVIPGPTSCFRSDVFERVDFDNRSLTEDFDVTLQLHRLKLGKVQFIPKAIAYTQDPKDLKDYTKQITRWNRGGFQGILRYRIGRKLSPIDAYLSYQLFQNLMFFFSYFIWVPILAITRHSVGVLAMAFVIDVVVTFMINFLVAMKSKRWDILSAFPQIYMLRFISLGIFLKSFVEVIVLRKFLISNGLWENNTSRRYVLEEAV
jgi:cellulose synthase/poly-beta-1,6-N-acetylglucosamine synthase-like glycosyltransferase